MNAERTLLTMTHEEVVAKMLAAPEVLAEYNRLNREEKVPCTNKMNLLAFRAVWYWITLFSGIPMLASAPPIAVRPPVMLTA